MARKEFNRHKKVNAAADDGVSEVQPTHWNNDAHDQVGVIGYDEPSETLIASGVLSPALSPGVIVVGAESGTADDLDTLTATDYQRNDRVSLRCTVGDTITVKHGTGNFSLPGSSDHVLSETIPLELIHNGTNWIRYVGNVYLQEANIFTKIQTHNVGTKFPDGPAIVDGNGNELLIAEKTTSAVNEITVKDAATGNNPQLKASGDDSNVGIDIKIKGSGRNLIEDTHIDIGGILGFIATNVTLATDVLAGTTTAIAVDAEGAGTTDDLSSITGFSNGDVVRLIAQASQVITVIHDIGGTNAIHLRHKVNIFLSETVPLVLRRIGNEWYEESGPEITVVELALGKPTDALATGDNQVTHVMDKKGRLIKCKAYVNTVSSSGLPTFNLRESSGGVDILSTALTIDASENSSLTAAAAAVIKSDGTQILVADEVVRVDCDIAGTGTLGAIITLWFENISDE